MEPPRDKTEHLVVLKVMRLAKPSLLCPKIVTTDSKDIPGGLLNDFLKQDITSVPGAETIAASSFLLLPQCFGNIYLGERFSCYICIQNSSTQIVKDVSFKATLQTTAHNILLSSDPPNSIDLVPGANVDEVIHHDVKEFGSHILTCEVSYCSSNLSSELRSFRKFFKFDVLKPLDVKTKIYNIDTNEVCLEAQIQNTTQGTLSLENVSLEPSSLFKVEKYTSVLNNLSDLNVMAPNECKPFLYLTIPRKDIDKKEVINAAYIGKLDIVWRSYAGERGHLQTSQINRLPPKFPDLHLSIEEIPSIVYLEEEFCITFNIFNNSERFMEIMLNLEESCGFAWCSPSGNNLGRLDSYSEKNLKLKLVPLSLGVLNVSGINLKDSHSNQVYQFDKVVQVFVLQREVSSISP